MYTFVKKEEELSFSVDSEEKLNNVCMQISFFGRLKSVRNDFKLFFTLNDGLSEPGSYHVKQKLTRVLSAFHATHLSVPIMDS